MNAERPTPDSPLPPGTRAARLEALRQELLDELEAAERELAALRTRVERLESDLRLGASPTEEYRETKGQALPRAEERLRRAFEQLLKIEEKLRAERR